MGSATSPTPRIMSGHVAGRIELHDQLFFALKPITVDDFCEDAGWSVGPHAMRPVIQMLLQPALQIFALANVDHLLLAVSDTIDAGYFVEPIKSVWAV